MYSLEIQNASVSDSGKYTIKAKNFHGQCSATASLTVLRKYIFAIFLICLRPLWVFLLIYFFCLYLLSTANSQELREILCVGGIGLLCEFILTVKVSLQLNRNVDVNFQSKATNCPVNIYFQNAQYINYVLYD